MTNEELGARIGSSMPVVKRFFELRDLAAAQLVLRPLKQKIVECVAAGSVTAADGTHWDGVVNGQVTAYFLAYTPD